MVTLNPAVYVILFILALIGLGVIIISISKHVKVGKSARFKKWYLNASEKERDEYHEFTGRERPHPGESYDD